MIFSTLWLMFAGYVLGCVYGNDGNIHGRSGVQAQTTGVPALRFTRRRTRQQVARVVIVLWSVHAVRSGFVKDEAARCIWYASARSNWRWASVGFRLRSSGLRDRRRGLRRCSLS
jgi:hypothetical protein